MASGERNGPSGEQPTEILVRDAHDEWPVDEKYLVATDEAVQPPDEQPATVVTPGRPFDPRRVLVDREWPLLAALLIAAVAVVGIAAWLVADDDASGPTRTIAAETTTTQVTTDATPPPDDDPAVPDLVGRTLQEARTALQDAGYRVRVVRRQSSAAAGSVLEQDPEAGTRRPADALVTLVIARAPAEASALVETPSLVGIRVSDASAAVRESGLRARIEVEPSGEPAGTVVAQSPDPGTEVAAGSVVTLTVAGARPEASARIQVPSVVGLDAAAARSRLRAAGLRVSVTALAAEAPAGTVLSQTPRAGARAEEGAVVALRVSTGPLEVDVPDVVGLDEASARFELESAGFQVRVTDSPTDDPDADGTVVAQSPSGGATAREGATVTITVARFD